MTWGPVPHGLCKSVIAEPIEFSVSEVLIGKPAYSSLRIGVVKLFKPAFACATFLLACQSDRLLLRALK
jgi:hypothetical protein